MLDPEYYTNESEGSTVMGSVLILILLALMMQGCADPEDKGTVAIPGSTGFGTTMIDGCRYAYYVRYGYGATLVPVPDMNQPATCGTPSTTP